MSEAEKHTLGQIDREIDTPAHRQTDKQIFRHADTEIHTYGQTQRGIDTITRRGRQKDRETNGQTQRCRDTDIWTDRERVR